MKKLPTHVLGDPYCWQFRTNGGLPMDPKWTNFFTFYHTKSKLKGRPFYEKNCQLMYLGLHNAGHFEQMWASANQPKMDQF